MTNQLQHFYNNEFGDLDIIMIGSEPYFPAKECAKLLGYKGAINAIKRHCRSVLKRHLGVQTGIRMDGTPAYQTVEKNYIPESDLYRLIIRSKLPAAQRFESWVCDEVLPAIREHGVYFTPETFEKMINDPECFAELLRELDRLHETPPKGEAVDRPVRALPAGKDS